MDGKYTIVKTDYIVPVVSGGIIRGPVMSNVIVSTHSSQLATLAASEIGCFVTNAYTDATVAGIALPAASSVTAYWGAHPGDVFTTTILNTGGAVQQIATDSNLGVVASVGHASTAAYLGVTFQYVVGGTVAVPSARVYIL